MKNMICAIACMLCLTALLRVPAAAADGPMKPGFTVKAIGPFTYCAVIHNGPGKEIAAVVGRLIEAMRDQQLFPMIRGTMLAVYHQPSKGAGPLEVSLEIGFPVPPGTAVQPPLELREWKYATVAFGMHVGPYEKCGETAAAIKVWLAGEG